MTDSTKIFEAGLALRREMFGAEHVARVVDGASAFTQALEEFTTRYCFGEIWTREGLNRRDRSMITIAMLVALGKSDKLPLHIEAAIANGVSIDELSEVLLHTALYAGIPASVEAYGVAEATLKEMGLVQKIT